MEKVLKAEKVSFIVATVLSVLLVAGIPCIVIGAKGLHGPHHAAGGFAALLAFGIIFVVLGFYGSPLAWVKYGTARQERTLVGAVVNEHLHTVADLAQRLNVNGMQASNLLNGCIRKGYLTGFIREGDSLVLNENTALAPTTYNVECSHCGASVTVQKGDSLRCPYCGSALNLPDRRN